MDIFSVRKGNEYRGKIPQFLTQNLLEDGFIQGQRSSIDLELPPTVSSTIAIATSIDGLMYASTHGDHTVKVFRFANNQCIRVFEGHPRTPWTVKFNPNNSDIVASGCLGCQVSVFEVSLYVDC